MLNVMYDIPSRTDIQKCVITKEVLDKKEEPILVTADRKKKREETA
jgi:ATP-dependent Clp protease ATP-binding subunit ClpX